MHRRLHEPRRSLPLLAVFVIAAASAQADEATPGAAAAATAPTAAADLGTPAGPNPDAGLPIGGFLVYPSIFVGVVYNDNLYATHDDRKAALGMLFSPNVTAVDDQGLHKTTLTLSGAITAFPDHTSSSNGQPSPTNVSGTIGAEHVWTPAEDLTVDVKAAFARQYGIFGSSVATNAGFISSPNVTSVSAYTQYSNQVSGSVAIEKKFNDQWFLRGGVGAQDTEYEGGSAGVAGGQSGADYNFFLRSGFWLTPQINAFVEGGADLRRYRDSWYDSNAYRVVGGLSSDEIGLFRGEIYGGYQKQFSARGNFGAVDAPAYGAAIYYYPTRYLTLAGRVDQSFGSAAAQTAAFAGSPSGDTVQTRLEADYSLSEYWNASARAGYARTTWSNSSLVESAWTFGGEINYNFWRNVALTLNYQYTSVDANRSGVTTYSQNLVSAGMTYHY